MTGQEKRKKTHEKHPGDDMRMLLLSLKFLLIIPGLFVLFLAPPILLFASTSMPDWLKTILFVAGIVTFGDLVSHRWREGDDISSL